MHKFAGSCLPHVHSVLQTSMSLSYPLHEIEHITLLYCLLEGLILIIGDIDRAKRMRERELSRYRKASLLKC